MTKRCLLDDEDKYLATRVCLSTVKLRMSIIGHPLRHRDRASKLKDHKITPELTLNVSHFTNFTTSVLPPSALCRAYKRPYRKHNREIF